MTRETKIGFWVFLILVVLGVVCLVFNPFERFHHSYYHVQAIMENAQGIPPGAQILYKGVYVGNVQETAVKDGKAVLTLKIKKDERIPKDVDVSVDTMGAAGDLFLRIDGGHDRAGFLANGDNIVEHPSDQVDRLLQKADKLMKTAGETADSIHKLKGDS